MIYAGILAGGTGTRMGISNLPKQFLDLGTKPIVIHTLEKFLLVKKIDKVILGVHTDWISHMEDLIDKYLPAFKNQILIAEGGTDRNSTIKNIILKITETTPLTEEDIIITHDSVRPFATLRMIEENIQLMEKYDAVDTVVSAVDTIVESVDGAVISSIPNRSHYYQGQTPQTFRCKEFLNLYDNLNAEEKMILTDACKIFVIKNKKVGLAKGEYSNIKVTTVTDLKVAHSMLKEIEND